MEIFKLRVTVPGHEKDVRCICSTTNDGGIISGSRDVTVRHWIPQGREFVQRLLLDGHSNFISSIEFAHPYRGSDNGVMFTGSNDSTIRAHDGKDGKYLFTLRAHNETVCSLKYSATAGLLVSGSWDKTARLWQDDQCIATLAGHDAAVWAVIFLRSGDGVITGSADKTIRLWRPLSFSQAKWTCQQRYIGHSDCVRGLALINEDEFISCSNDASIRMWKVSGESIREFYGHTNFIYGLAVLPSGEEFVSCSEDRSIRLWNITGGDSIQSLTLPCQSVWCVTVLNNGDIAVGGNDAMIRVFTKNPDMVAPESEQVAFTDQVSSMAIPGQVGDIKLNEVPGPEILSRPGKSEGFVTMVRRGTAVECYQWSQGQWSKIGDVVGSSGATQQSSGKQLYEGREYDYVFTVDVVEGAPPLKLPYNINEDPYMSAQNFIHKHNLPQEYLDQVAEFITKQTEGPTLQQSSASAATYVDPFTGGGRYVPGSGVDAGTGAGSDPFTGGGRYVPGAGAASTFEYKQPESTSPTYFPVRELLSFDTVNIEALLKKLNEFNGMETEQFSDDQLKKIRSVCEKNSQFDADVFSNITAKISSWDQKRRFPLLDIVRLAVRNPQTNVMVFKSADFLETLLSQASDDSCGEVNCMLIYRIIVNACRHSHGQKQVLDCASDLLDHLKKKVPTVSKSSNNFQTTFSTIILNLSILLGLADAPDLLLSEFLMILGGQLLSYPSLGTEATFRLIVSMGTLIDKLKGNDRTTLVLVSDLPNVISRLCNLPEKVGAAARDLRLVLSQC